MAGPGGMQLKAHYHAELDSEFLSPTHGQNWKGYSKEFTTKRDIYDHWSAGHRSTPFADYHIITIENDDGVSHVHNCDVATDMHGHTDGRNTGSIGLCIASMYQGGTTDLGAEPPSPAQIRAHLNLIIDICCNLRIPHGRYLTHQEAADMMDYVTAGISPNNPSNMGAPPYGPVYGRGQWACYRWDFYVDIDIRTLKLYPHLDDQVPAGREFYPDWVRGQLILAIQERTRKYWDPNYKVPVTSTERSHGEGR